METLFTNTKALKVLYNKETKVATVSMNRPTKLNAFNQDMFEEIAQVFRELPQNSLDIRCIVLEGSGRSFSAGLDLKEMAPKIMESASLEAEPLKMKRAFTKFIKYLQETFDAVDECRIPVIGAIQGYCFGAGVALAAACDVNLCSKDAKFSIKEVDLGIVADIGSVQRIAKLNGDIQLLKQVTFTGNQFNWEKAKKLNLVTEVLDSAEEMKAAAFKLAEEIASKSPLIINGIKNTIEYSTEHSKKDSLLHVTDTSSNSFLTKDSTIAFESMMTKQKPNYPKF